MGLCCFAYRIFYPSYVYTVNSSNVLETLHIIDDSMN